MLKSDAWILSKISLKDLINPAVAGIVDYDDDGNRIISYGPSAYGYDIRLDNKFKIYSNVHEPGEATLDPKNLSDSTFVELTVDEGASAVIYPGSLVLGVSVEYLKLPSNVTAVMSGKYTYNRAGLSLDGGIISAGFEGHLNIRLVNNTPNKIKIYPGEGVAQLIFFESDDICIADYASRNGRYYKQSGVYI